MTSLPAINCLVDVVLMDGETYQSRVEDVTDRRLTVAAPTAGHATAGHATAGHATAGHATTRRKSPRRKSRSTQAPAARARRRDNSGYSARSGGSGRVIGPPRRSGS